MVPDDPSGARPAAPIVLRIKLRYDDLDVMVQRFAANVGKSGLFLPTRSLQPLGAEVKFELRLADDTPALVGLGRVKAAQPPDPHNPRATYGMAIELMRVTPQSRALILRMLERRRTVGLPDTQLPSAADVDAARRGEAVEAVRDLASGPVVAATSAAAIAASDAAASDAAAASGPVVAGDAVVAASDALLTAPRMTAPSSAVHLLAVAPLGPEPPRRKRTALSEILDSVSGPSASVATAVPGLDDDVDLGAALARARVLAGGAVDAELDALAELAAVPVEISVEGASAELARQLGGAAVRRDRSARWAPPPMTAPPALAESPVAESAIAKLADAEPADAKLADAESARANPAAAESADAELADAELADAELADAESAVAESAVSESAVAESALAASAHAAPAIAESAETAPVVAESLRAEPSHAPTSWRAPAADALAEPGDEPAPPELTTDPAAPAAAVPVDEVPSPVHAGEPAQADEEIHQLDDFDLEDVEHTELGDVPVAEVFTAHSEPPNTDGFAAQRDAPPADVFAAQSDAPVAEVAAVPGDASVAEDFAAHRDAPVAEVFAAHSEVPAPSDVFDDDDDHDDHHHADHNHDHDHRDNDDDDNHEIGLAIEQGHDPGDPPVDLSLEEIDEFEIIAEADAEGDDERLRLPNSGAPMRLDLPELAELPEHDKGGELHRPPPAGTRPSDSDFAARLDFGDDSDADFALPANDFSARHVAHAMSDDLAEALADLPVVPGARAGRRTEPPALGAPDELDPDELHDRFAQRRIVQPIFEIESSNSFTLAGIPHDDFELPPAPREDDTPVPRRATRRHSFDESEPAMLTAPPAPRSLHDSPVEDHELEHALDALDVDLDDLSIPHAATQLQRGTEASRSPAPSATRPPPPLPVDRSTSDNGRRSARPPSLDDDEVIIEFDDD